MLKKFRVSNFRTLYDEFELNMESNNQTDLEEKIINVQTNNGDVKLLPSKIILGENAVGKSSIIIALKTLKSIVLSSSLKTSNDFGSNYSIYSSLLDCKSYEEPIKFYIDFIDANNDEYEYYLNLCNRLSNHSTFIDYEGLTINGVQIFERKNNHLTLNKTKSILDKYYDNVNADYLGKTENVYQSNMNESNIFLSYLQFAPKICDPFKIWFDKGIFPLLDTNDLNLTLQIKNFENANAGNYKVINDTILQLVKATDFGKQKIYYSISKDENGIVSKPQLMANYELYDNKKQYLLNVPVKNTESTGTCNLVELFPLIKQIINYGGALIMDELDKSLSYIIIQNILSIFFNPEINKHGAQIIFTTHNPVYLSNKIFRRDEIMFMEKNIDTLRTTGYTLADLDVRKDENYLKNYLAGNYVHISSIDFGELMQDED